MGSPAGSCSAPSHACPALLGILDCNTARHDQNGGLGPEAVVASRLPAPRQPDSTGSPDSDPVTNRPPYEKMHRGSPPGKQTPSSVGCKVGSSISAVWRCRRRFLMPALRTGRAPFV